MCITPSLTPQFCAFATPMPIMPYLAKLNKWLLEDRDDLWTEEDLDAAMFPPEQSCLDIQVMPMLKPKPVQRPTINEFHAKLNNSCDNLFFVAFESEWRLVSVANRDTMSLHVDCLWVGKFLVDLYILLPKDYWCDAPNQCFWLEYHQPGSSNVACWKNSYHLIHPTRESHLYATSKGLVPHWK